MSEHEETQQTAATGPRPWWHYLWIGVIGRSPRRTAVRIAVYVVVAWGVFGYVLRPMRVAGISMEPTYKLNQVNFINRWSYLKREPQRGDVVAVRMAGESVLYLKRIIGLPGERVRIRQGQVYIDDEPLREEYVKNRAPWNESEMELGPDEYFLVGDNRGMALRDHEHGAVRRSKIVGKVLL
jgi:signal peptidase I